MIDLDARQFAQWSNELSEEALELFDRLADLHLSTDRAETREFVWARSQSLAAGHSSLAFLGRSHRGEIPHAQSDVQELVDARVLRRGDGRNHLRLDGRALRFHQWRNEAVAPQPVQQVERAGLLSMDDAGSLTRAHPVVGRHLRDARARLASGELDDSAVIAIGGSLRAALAGMAADLIGYDVNPEMVATALGPWLAEAETVGRVPPRQAEALTSLLNLTLRCCQRLDHLRHERSRGRPEPTPEEVRRTLFLTVTSCYELDRI